MEKETTGTVVKVSRQWWLKVNTKPMHFGPFDGAVFPHIIKVTYNVAGTDYTRRKWISAGTTPPQKDDTVKIIYDDTNPGKGKIIL